jgi:hypothetical protein
VTQTGDKLANEIFTWEVILLEKAIATKLDKKCHTFYGTPLFIPELISPCTLPYSEPAESSPKTQALVPQDLYN